MLGGMIRVYCTSNGEARCICFQGEEMPDGSPLRLVGVFGDNEAERAWAFLNRLSVAGMLQAARAGEYLQDFLVL
jgi:hypothetical protein